MWLPLLLPLRGAGGCPGWCPGVVSDMLSVCCAVGEREKYLNVPGEAPGLSWSTSRGLFFAGRWTTARPFLDTIDSRIDSKIDSKIESFLRKSLVGAVRYLPYWSPLPFAASDTCNNRRSRRIWLSWCGTTGCITPIPTPGTGTSDLGTTDQRMVAHVSKCRREWRC